MEEKQKHPQTFKKMTRPSSMFLGGFGEKVEETPYGI
jgi:hypothetical protein